MLRAPLPPDPVWPINLRSSSYIQLEHKTFSLKIFIESFYSSRSIQSKVLTDIETLKVSRPLVCLSLNTKKYNKILITSYEPVESFLDLKETCWNWKSTSYILPCCYHNRAFFRISQNIWSELIWVSLWKKTKMDLKGIGPSEYVNKKSFPIRLKTFSFASVSVKLNSLIIFCTVLYRLHQNFDWSKIYFGLADSVIICFKKFGKRKFNFDKSNVYFEPNC